MAEKTTIARPYAQAAFDLARDQKALARWSQMLELASVIATHEDIQVLVGNPRITRAQLAQLFLDVGGSQFDVSGQNFIRMLAENGRLTVLPEIAALFQSYRAEAERTIEAQVVSAYPLDADQQRHIAAALKTRLGREVALQARVDPQLIGGAIIRAGDMVIDGSVTGQLTQLTAALSR